MKEMSCNTLTYLCITIKNNLDAITIDQSLYLLGVLRKFGMENCKCIESPMDANYKFNENCDIDYSYEKQCRVLIGSLMYATVGSRPDLAASVYYISRFQSKPGLELWKALKRVFRYIRGTVEYQLVYKKDRSNAPVVGFADADWDRDSDRKSTTGYVYKVYRNTVVWKSKKQATVALSTTEAEFVSLCEAAIEACWIRKIMLDLDISVNSITIFEDNQSTIKAVKNPDQKRLKHMDIKFNFVKQKVEEGVININYVSSKEQLADVLTKPLCKTKFKFLVSRLGLNNKNMSVEEEC